ncbi:MAG: hypothetical protein IJS62_00215 [Bacteroidales bacterium]|nr:hypothetical protein [Bacteroidales bacterium]
MNTKILYVLVSDGSDCYAEQLMLSLTSLRRHCPGAEVCVLTDNATMDALPSRGGSGKTLLALPDRWIVADPGADLPKHFRSRILKTEMREHIQGDFLYIDTDTIVLGPLDAIDDVSFPLALCLDHHCALRDIAVKKDIAAHCRQVGFDITEDDTYFNSGVIFARDCPEVRDFFRSWKEKYLAGRERGIKEDQPSLAWVVAEKPIAGRLDEVWNCQLPYGVRYMKDARIFHYFAAGQDGSRLFLFNRTDVLEEIKRSGGITGEADAVLEDPFKGISPLSYLSSTEDFSFFTTRRYRDLRRLYRPGKFSVLEFLLKVRARLLARR